MGSWNKTCGLTNLHIMAGEQVYVFALVEVPRSTDRCYSTAFWSPIKLNFVAEYDDYGSAENCSFELDYIVQSLRKRLTEIVEGSNQYHDIAVTRDKFDKDLFFESVREHRLQVGVRSGDDDSMIDLVMMRKDVVDKILNEYKFKKYVGESVSSSGYVNIGFADLVSAIPDLIEKIENAVKDEPEVGKPGLRRAMFSLGGISGIFNFDYRENPISGYVSQDRAASNAVNVDAIVVDLIYSGDKTTAAKLLESYVRGNFVEAFMEATRKQWMPAGHEGSQSSEIDPYRFLCNAITDVLDAEEKEREEW